MRRGRDGGHRDSSRVDDQSLRARRPRAAAAAGGTLRHARDVTAGPARGRRFSRPQKRVGNTIHLNMAVMPGASCKRQRLRARAGARGTQLFSGSGGPRAHKGLGRGHGRKGRVICGGGRWGGKAPGEAAPLKPGRPQQRAGDISHAEAPAPAPTLAACRKSHPSIFSSRGIPSRRSPFPGISERRSAG